MRISVMLLMALLTACSTFGCNSPTASEPRVDTAAASPTHLPLLNFAHTKLEGEIGRAFVPEMMISGPIPDGYLIYAFGSGSPSTVSVNPTPVGINAYEPGTAVVCISIMSRSQMLRMIDTLPTSVPQFTRHDLRIKMLVENGKYSSCATFVVEKVQ